MTLLARSLKITNFRCFRDAAITLHPRLTVVVADNGMGKTALLDALATCLAEYTDSLLGIQSSPGLLPSDVRAAAEGDGSTHLSMTADLSGAPVEWALSRKSATSPMRRGPKQLKAMRDAAVIAKQRVADADAALPIFAYYQSTRFAHSTYFGQKYIGTGKPLEGRLVGYTDYLTPLLDAARFNDWYAARWRAVAKRASPGIGVGQDPLAQLSSVRSAVSTVLEPTGWSVIDWDDARGCVVVEHAVRGRLPLSWLSSGIRSMVALTADLAHRCASLNPQLREDAAAKTPGVVLIDEVDLHLHPSWQQRVVELLQSAFGAMQIVVTTHSPQVLSTVYADSVRIVRHHGGDSTVEPVTFQTRGVESADVLAQIMGVDSTPRVKEAQDLQRFRNLIESGEAESAEGVALRQSLLQHFGEHHPLMLDCARLERFVAFKRKQKPGGAN